MNKSLLLSALLVPAFLLAGMPSGSALAQEKKAAKKAEKAPGKPTVRNVASDDKVTVTLVTYKPGDGREIKPGHRVVRALKGGTLERTHPNGKKEKVTWKEGQVRINKPTEGYQVRNVGDSEVQLYIVDLK